MLWRGRLLRYFRRSSRQLFCGPGSVKLDAHILERGDQHRLSTKDRLHTPHNLPRGNEDRRAWICALDLCANFLSEVFQCIGTSEDQVDNFRSDAQLRSSHGIEERFQIMRKVTERLEMQEAGATLKSVKGAENRIRW